MFLQHLTICVVFCSIFVGFTTAGPRLATNTIPESYDLILDVDTINYKFNGRVVIKLEATSTNDYIQLHQKDLLIVFTSLTDITSRSQLTLKTTAYDLENEVWTIFFNENLIKDNFFELRLEFSGNVRNDMMGLYRSTYYNAGKMTTIATTFSAAAFSRMIFPCYDEPQLKATFKLTLNHHSSFNALSNMPILLSTPNNADEIKTIFQETGKMSTYLFAFTISDFTPVSNAAGNFSVYSAFPQNTKYALEFGQKALSMIEEQFDVKYQLPKMDFLAIDDFLYGAMENPGIISFKSSRLLLSEEKHNRRLVQDAASVISHELVHQWFGNDVTSAWWSWIWLNEAFASLLESSIIDKIHPKWRMMDQFVVDVLQDVMPRDSNPNVRAMTKPITTVAEINNVYDFVVYPKGASVIRMMEHVLGADVFKKSIQLYLKENSLDSTTEDDLFDSLEEGNKLYGSPLPPISSIFKSWSNNPGFPLLTVTRDYTKNSFEIQQERFFSSFDSNLNKTSNFYIPINFATAETPNFQSTLPSNWMKPSEKKIEIDARVKADDWVILNIQQTGYYRVNYDDTNWDLLIEQLKKNMGAIHILNRAQLLDDALNLARYNYISLSKALDLMQYLQYETDFIPMVPGIKLMDFLIRRFDGQDFYSEFEKIVIKTVTKMYDVINSQNIQHPDDDHFFKLSKLTVNMFTCRLGIGKCIVDSILTGQPADIHSRPYVYCGSLKIDSQDALKTSDYLITAWKLLTMSETNRRNNFDDLNQVVYALTSCHSNEQQVEKILKEVLREDLTPSDRNAIFGNLVKSGSLGAIQVLEFIGKNYEEVNRKASFNSALTSFGEYLNNDQERNLLISLIDDNNVPRSPLVLETLKKIQENIDWLMKVAPEAKTWTSKNFGVAVNGSILLVVLSVLLNYY